jgi:hypothetical protein
MAKHLYRGKGTPAREQKEFEERYPGEKRVDGHEVKRGDYVYGAVVGERYRANHHGRNWNQKRKRTRK